MTTYRLTDTARPMEWNEWREEGGCGLSGLATQEVVERLGPVGQWYDARMTLGEIADVSVLADREIARYALEHRGRHDLAAPEEPNSDLAFEPPAKASPLSPTH